MAKRKAAARRKPVKSAKTRRAAAKPPPSRVKRAKRARPARKRVRKPARKPARQTVRKKAPKRTTARKRDAAPITPTKVARLDRARRTLDDVVPTPPSSLDMTRRGSAARTGRAELEQHRREHGDMASVTAGDVDVNVDNAYFSGDEAPGGDNPTPDMEIVDDIGKALGVQYNDNEELRSGDKLSERDKHRWELDPASSEDYKRRD